jgi:hypothetical protein
MFMLDLRGTPSQLIAIHELIARIEQRDETGKPTARVCAGRSSERAWQRREADPCSPSSVGKKRGIA